MPKKRTSPHLEEKTIAWFEQTIQARTPQSGLLDTANWGMLAIAEVGGGLVGAWRRYRMQQEDLDVEAVSQSLGALLEAIVRTANALDLSLETLMQQQVQRVQTLPVKGTKSSATPKTASTPRAPLSPPPPDESLTGASRVRKGRTGMQTATDSRKQAASATLSDSDASPTPFPTMPAKRKRQKTTPADAPQEKRKQKVRAAAVSHAPQQSMLFTESSATKKGEATKDLSLATPAHRRGGRRL